MTVDCRVQLTDEQLTQLNEKEGIIATTDTGKRVLILLSKRQDKVVCVHSSDCSFTNCPHSKPHIKTKLCLSPGCRNTQFAIKDIGCISSGGKSQDGKQTRDKLNPLVQDKKDGG